MGQPHGVAIVGLGVISRAYLDTIGSHPDIEVVAVADLDRSRADEVATACGAESLAVADAMTHPRVDTVLNLTIPASHADIALEALAAGKGVYGEKPLASTVEDARQVIAAADAADLSIGCAPDTVLGTGIQTARAAVEQGLVGTPISAVATWYAPGHEIWHPNPDFYYAEGGGPLLDMGPYYITSLVHILGPVVSVTGAASRMRDVRTIGSGPRLGAQIAVSVATHVTGVLEHASGALSTIVVSFDGVRTDSNAIEIHGDRGSLAVPDPNQFSGVVSLSPLADSSWRPLEPMAGFVDGSRGVGLLDFATRRPGEPRASGKMAFHVLEIMAELLASAADGQRRTVASSVALPEIVPLTPRDVWAAGTD